MCFVLVLFSCLIGFRLFLCFAFCGFLVFGIAFVVVVVIVAVVCCCCWFVLFALCCYTFVLILCFFVVFCRVLCVGLLCFGVGWCVVVFAVFGFVSCIAFCSCLVVSFGFGSSCWRFACLLLLGLRYVVSFSLVLLCVVFRIVFVVIWFLCMLVVVLF